MSLSLMQDLSFNGILHWHGDDCDLTLALSRLGLTDSFCLVGANVIVACIVTTWVNRLFLLGGGQCDCCYALSRPGLADSFCPMGINMAHVVT